ncbi:MAG: hypothetical protein HQL41_12425 [Alphaproteobacteria bacterium]|nr:hypothetical protein [Alphaproteobacteria bacterium]
MNTPRLGDGSSVTIDLDEAAQPARPDIRTSRARLDQLRDRSRDDADRLRALGTGLVTTRPVAAGGGLDQVKGYTIPMPRRVNLQLEEEARRQGVPKKVIVLKALKAAGFDVRDEDLEDRRGIVMKQVAAERRTRASGDGER